MRRHPPPDLELGLLDPVFMFELAEVRERALRRQRDREMAGRLFAEELLARGIRPPRGQRYDRNGRSAA